MGFTRYWYIDEKLRTFPAGATKEIKAVFERYKSIIQFDSDNPAPPVLRKNMIRFNGKGEDGHETFYIKLPMKLSKFQKDFIKNHPGVPNFFRHQEHKEQIFGFCKTVHKPYDVVVEWVLVILKKYWGDKISVSSD
jgi:hypothetical protein